MTIACRLAVCLVVCSSATASEDKATKRVYTNEDLERLREKRGETGVESQVTPVAADPRQGTPKLPETRDEEYWRREAEREHDRLEPMRRRLSDLEQKLLERKAAPTPRSGIRPPTEGLAAQIRALRERIRAQQERFHDRARREGALPGWLR